MFYHPPLSAPSDAQPRGLTLTPHAAGLLVKAVWGWAAAEGRLAVGDVIVGTTEDVSGDRAAMATRLSGQDAGCYQLTVARHLVLPHEWIHFPSAHDVSV